MLVIDICFTFVVVTFQQLLDVEIDQSKNFERMLDTQKDASFWCQWNIKAPANLTRLIQVVTFGTQFSPSVLLLESSSASVLLLEFSSSSLYFWNNRLIIIISQVLLLIFFLFYH